MVENKDSKYMPDPFDVDYTKLSNEVYKYLNPKQIGDFKRAFLLFKHDKNGGLNKLKELTKKYPNDVVKNPTLALALSFLYIRNNDDILALDLINHYVNNKFTRKSNSDPSVYSIYAIKIYSAQLSQLQYNAIISADSLPRYEKLINLNTDKVAKLSILNNYMNSLLFQHKDIEKAESVFSDMKQIINEFPKAIAMIEDIDIKYFDFSIKKLKYYKNISKANIDDSELYKKIFEERKQLQQSYINLSKAVNEFEYIEPNSHWFLTVKNFNFLNPRKNRFTIDGFSKDKDLIERFLRFVPQKYWFETETGKQPLGIIETYQSSLTDLPHAIIRRIEKAKEKNKKENYSDLSGALAQEIEGKLRVIYTLYRDYLTSRKLEINQRLDHYKQMAKTNTDPMIESMKQSTKKYEDEIKYIERSCFRDGVCNVTMGSFYDKLMHLDDKYYGEDKCSLSQEFVSFAMISKRVTQLKETGDEYWKNLDFPKDFSYLKRPELINDFALSVQVRKDLSGEEQVIEAGILSQERTHELESMEGLLNDWLANIRLFRMTRNTNAHSDRDVIQKGQEPKQDKQDLENSLNVGLFGPNSVLMTANVLFGKHIENFQKRNREEEMTLK